MPRKERRMTRDDYERYLAAFNARDYDTVFDFYAEHPRLAFFGVEIHTREELREFYTFLHANVRETAVLERFAGSDELVAAEAIVRVEGIADLTREVLDKRGLQQFFPIAKGDVQEMRQYIHYHLANGKITSVGCAIVG
jgi:SnoaL-like domain